MEARKNIHNIHILNYNFMLLILFTYISNIYEHTLD